MGHSWLSCIQWSLSIEGTTRAQLAVLYTVDLSIEGTTRAQLAVLYTVEPLSIEDIIGTQLAVLYTVEPLYSGHHWDPVGCPVYSGTSL